MRYIRRIKILLILLLPILIYTFSFPYINTNELKAEEVTLEEFDDSPSGGVIIEKISKNGTVNGGYAFITNDGKLYMTNCNDGSTYGSYMCGSPNVALNTISRPRTPDSTSGKISYFNDIEDISVVSMRYYVDSTYWQVATVLARGIEGNFYVWGWNPGIPSVPLGHGVSGRTYEINKNTAINDEKIKDIQINGNIGTSFFLCESGNLYYKQYQGAEYISDLKTIDLTYANELGDNVVERVKSIHIDESMSDPRTVGYVVSENDKIYILSTTSNQLNKGDIKAWGPLILPDNDYLLHTDSMKVITMPDLFEYNQGKTSVSNIKMFCEKTECYGIPYYTFTSANDFDKKEPILSKYTKNMYLNEYENAITLGLNNKTKIWLTPEMINDIFDGTGKIKWTISTYVSNDRYAEILLANGKYYRIKNGSTYSTSNNNITDYFAENTLLPDNYSHAIDVSGKIGAESFVLSESGAAYKGNMKLTFYNDTIITGIKVNGNTPYYSAYKYNDNVDVTITRTPGINNGKIYYREVDNTDGKIDLTNSSIPETEITDANGITFNLEINDDQKRIQKTYVSYTKNADGSIIDGSDSTFVVDLFQSDISIPDLEGQSAFSAGKKIKFTYSGFEGNTITAKLNKTGEEPTNYISNTTINDPGSYTLTATDTYGNTKTYAFSILGPDDPLGLTFTKNSSGTLEYDNTITKANAQIGTVSLQYGEDASTTGTIDLTSTSISAGNDDGYFSIDGDQLKVEKDLPAGTYTLTIDGSDSNGVAFSFPVEIVIAQKEIAISLSISDITYGETLSIGADEVSGLPTGFTPTIEMKSEGETIGSYTDGVFTPSKVGTATFGVSVNDPAGNYTFTCTDQTITVKPKSVTLSLTQPIVKYAGESLANVTPAASDNYTITPALLNGDTLSGTATYAYVSGSDATASGETIKVKITGLSNDNYTITETATELSVTAGDEIKEGWYKITGTKNTGFDWYASDVSVAIDASKSGSYNLISKDGDFAGATSSFVLNTDEIHNLSIQMKNGVSGRLTQPKDEVIKIDRVTPVFTIVGKAGKQSVTSGVETKGPVVLSGSLTSTNASTVSYYYTTVASDASTSPVNDSSKWTLITDGGLTASKEGSTTYYMKAVSGAGLVSDVQEFTTVINNDVTTPSSIAWSDGLSEQELIYGASLSLQISGLQNEEVAYSIIEGDASKVTIHTNTHTLTANSGTGTIKVQAKIKGYKEPLVKTITLKKKELTVKTQISNKDTISIDLHGTLPQTSEFGIVSSDLVNGDTISLLSSVTYEYRDDDGSVITPVTSAKGTYKLYAKITSSLDNYTIKTIVPAIVTIGGDITYTELHVKTEYLKNGAYVPYQDGTWVNQEIRFTLQGGIQDANKITGYEYIISSTKPNMNDPKWTSISDGTKMTHTVTQASHNATYWFRVTPYTEGAKLSKQTTINLDLVNPEPPVLIIKEKPRNALEKALNAMSFNSWFKQEVEVSFTSSDQDSGVKEIVYEERTDKGSTSHTIPYGTTITYAADTTLYLKAKAIDHAGNTSTFGKEEPLAIDMSAPIIKGVKNQKEYKQYYVPRFVTVTDSGSGLKQATYKKDNSSEIAFTENVEEKIKGEGRYEIYAIDEAGNETTLTFKIVSLPDIKTEIDGSDESKEIIDQIIKELEEVKDKIDQNEKENYDKWIEDATDKWNDLRMKVVEDQETTSKVEGQGDTTFDPKTELIVEEIPKDQVPVLPKHAIKTYDVYLMKGEKPVQPDGSVKVYLPYEESEPPIVYEIGEDGRVTQLSVKQEGGYVTFVTTVLKKYAISNTAQGDTSGDHDPTPDDPSQNDQQCVVGPDGKPETADDVCAGGNGEDQPVKKPDGSITVPEGGVIIFPDQEVPAPDGAIINPDGSVDFPDGSHLDSDGNKDSDLTPDPTPDDGKGDDNPDPTPNPNPDDQDPDTNNPDTNKPDGNICTAGPDGVSDTSDDVCGTPNDKGEKPVINPDGSITIPDGGSVIFPDGSEVELPDGGIIKPDGTVELPDGTIINPDGTKKDPEKPKRECKIKGIKLNVDSDTDGLPDLNLDIDDDCVADLNIDMDNDAIPDLNIDTTGNGLPDLNIDANTDGIAEINIKKLSIWTPNLNTSVNGFAYDTMTGIKADLNIDVDGDGIADVNIDSDGDGIADTNIIGGQAQGNGSDAISGTNTADTTKWSIWFLMVIITIITMIYSIVHKRKRV